MSGKCAAYAVAYFPDIGQIDSLPKAGLDKHGNIKNNACFSESSARRRAVYSVMNKLRYRRFGSENYVYRDIFETLSPELFQELVDEVTESVEWVIHTPSSHNYVSRGTFDSKLLQRAYVKITG
tara:strand:+ start:150 stop:521 length:372 start_codon:yes stop_codon:yes gene_type:complete